MRGSRLNAEPPLWAIAIELAGRWHVPPWQIEDEMTAEWWQRIMTFERIKNKTIEDKRGKKHS
jgi:hypothetical protein